MLSAILMIAQVGMLLDDGGPGEWIGTHPGAVSLIAFLFWRACLGGAGKQSR